MLEKSDVGLFLFTNIGEERMNRIDTVRHLFKVCGYRSLTCGSVTVQGMSASTAFKALERMPGGPPPVGMQSGAETLLPPSAFLTLDPERIMGELRLLRFPRARRRLSQRESRTCDAGSRPEQSGASIG
jgi:hypothetical protein